MVCKKMEALKAFLSDFNKETDSITLKRFQTYMERILEWNEKVNLTAIKDRDEFIKKHFIDSLLCVRMPEIEGAATVLDLGTGAGFPGIPLALVYPEKEFVLVDSLAKRLKIIDEICRELQIENVTVVHARAEELAQKKEYRENFDLCVSRAVANFATLSEYCLPFVKIGGSFLAYKGPDAEKEIADAGNAAAILGGEIIQVYAPKLSGLEYDHRIITVKKKMPTPAKYPRKAGTPSKEPLK